jgi:hypothetical protein
VNHDATAGDEVEVRLAALLADARSQLAAIVADARTDVATMRAEAHTEIAAATAAAGRQISDLERGLIDLDFRYREAGENVVARTHVDADRIEELRAEAERVVALLQGGSLFGRYAADADRHRRTANAWRWFSVAVLVVATALAIALPLLVDELSWEAVLAPILPLVLLFTYASIESFNHRQREFDRRRIYLRMAALESYTGEKPTAKSRQILEDFIRKHFIEQDLDDNQLNYVGARGWGPFVALIGRRRDPPPPVPPLDQAP